MTAENNLHAGNRSVNVLGSVTKSTLHHDPVFRAGQIVCGEVGGVLEDVGLTRY